MISTLVDRRRNLCGRVQAVGAISGRRRHLEFSAYFVFGEVAGRGECPAPAPFTSSKRQIPRTKDQVRPSEGLHCLGTATPPWPGAHQASMLHSCAEVRERIDPNRPAANHTLPAALVQG